MILGAINQAAMHGRRDTDRYAAWRALSARLRSDFSSGIPVEIDALPRYLQSVHPDDRRQALQDAIALHLRLSWANGVPVLLDCYRRWLSDIEPIAPQVIEEEFLARHQLPHGDAPSIDEYRRRFADRPDALALLESRQSANGRYLRLRRIGHGALGEIWEAHDRDTPGHVAIKFPAARPPRGISREMLGHRLLREARITASLHHPLIVPVRDIAEDDPPFYVMPMLPGPGLHAEIARVQALTRSARRAGLRTLLQSLVNVCRAIHHAHQHNVVHADLKPANVIVPSPGAAIVLDWGLARRLDHSDPAFDHPHLLRGTPQYMAPEQFDGHCEPRSDIFALGAILYQVLTGRPPRDLPAAAPLQVWTAAARDFVIAPPRLLDPRADHTLEQICLKAMHRDPSHRFASAHLLAESITRYLDRRPPGFLSRWLGGRSHLLGAPA